MCGIVGYLRGVQNLSKSINDTPLAKFMADATFVGTLRGDDGTGLMAVDRHGFVDTCKLPISGDTFVKSPWVNNFFDKTKVARGMIAHHRSMTRGIPSPANTHPFRHKVDGKGIVGVHNGTVAAPLNEDGIRFDVDSDWCMYRLAKDGDDAYKKFDGAFSFVYYRDDTKRFYLATNEERPLFIGFIKDEDIMMIASEPGMMRWLANRRGFYMDADKENKTIEAVYRLTKGYILEFPEDNLRDYTKKEIQLYQKPVVSTSTSVNDDWYQRGPRNQRKPKGETVVKGGNGNTNSDNAIRHYGENGGSCIQVYAENLIRDGEADIFVKFTPSHYNAENRECCGRVTLHTYPEKNKSPKEEHYIGYIQGLTRKEYRELVGELVKGDELWTPLLGKRRSITVDGANGNIENVMYYVDKPFAAKASAA